MRYARHVVALLAEVARFAAATRRWSLVVFVVLGLAAVALGLVTSLVAPIAIYPFV